MQPSSHQPPRFTARRLTPMGLVSLLVLSLLAGSNFLGTTRAAHAQGDVIFVKLDASGSNNGTSWANAYTSLQMGLSVATSGDEIWVAAATYVPGITTNSTFTLKNGVALYGGFAGSEESRDLRDWEGNPTILSGRYGSSLFVAHVVMGSALNASAVLDGFTIADGRADGAVDNCPDKCGGGIYLDEGSPTLANLIIKNNFAKYGAGMVNNHSSQPTLTNVTFDQNVTDTEGWGGGMYNYQSGPTLINVSFSENKAKFGAGIANHTDGNPTLINVTFDQNETFIEGSGGGMYSESSNPDLTDVTFSGNLASNSGGGMYNKNGNPVLNDVAFIGNKAFFNNGGGMHNESSDTTLTNVTFIGNSADNVGGGMANYNNDPILSSVSFSGNRTGSVGGGVYYSNSRPIMTNVTLSGNQAPFGAGLSISVGTLLMQNSIIWGNGASAADNISHSGGTYTYRHSLIEGGLPAGSTNGGNNLSSAPLFVRAVNCGEDGCGVGNNDDFGDLRLQAASPAIDAGDNNADLNGTNPGNFTITSILSDPNGDLRIEAVKMLPATVDIGAYEYVNTVSPQAGGPYAGDEGAAIALNGSASSDETSISTYSWDCTNNGTIEVTANSPTGSSCTYPDNGTFTLRLTTTDTVGLSGFATATVTIANVVPVLTDPPNQSTAAATAKNFTLGTFADPGADAPWQVVIDWGDNSPTAQVAATNAGALPATPHTYAQAGTYNVVVTVSDEDGSDSGGFQVVVNAAPPGTPSVTAPDNQSATAGEAQNFLLGSFSDAGDAGPWQVTVNWGDSTAETIFNSNSTGALINQSHTYAAAGAYNVLVTVSDGDLEASASFQAVIEAPPGAPVVTAPINQSVPAGEAQSFALGSFSDAGDAGPWQVTVNWGDNSAETLFPTAIAGALPNKSHTYAIAGTYNVLVTVSDGELEANASFQILSTGGEVPEPDQGLYLPSILDD